MCQRILTVAQIKGIGPTVRKFQLLTKSVEQEIKDYIDQIKRGDTIGGAR